MMMIRLQRWYVTIPSLDQWWTTIVNHQNQWLLDPKTIEKPLNPMVVPNHSIQWWWCFFKTTETLQWYQIVVLKFQTVLILSSVCKITWELWHDLWDSFVSFSIIKFTTCEKIQNVAIVSFFRSLERAKTIVDHRVRLWWKPLKNHWCQWSISEKTFNGDGSVVAKPLKYHW